MIEDKIVNMNSKDIVKHAGLMILTGYAYNKGIKVLKKLEVEVDKILEE